MCALEETATMGQVCRTLSGSCVEPVLCSGTAHYKGTGSHPIEQEFIMIDDSTMMVLSSGQGWYYGTILAVPEH